MDWLTDNAWLAWVGVALVLAAVEAATVDLVFLMLCGGAFAGAFAAALGVPFVGQVAIAIAVAVLLLALVRPLMRRRFLQGDAHRSIGASSLVGRQARVIQAVTAVDGRVKLGGETWSARTTEGGPTCRPGDEVRVVAIDGATAIVTPVPLTTEPTPSEQ
ncbi:MAG TPA: NfeD family protein [Dermatophilaceae bacterium]|nr:NfeD family protein [Dermatophilaceae bacterium]